MSRERICFIVEGTEMDGDTRQLLDLCRHLDRRRWQLHVVSLQVPRGAVFDIQRLDVPVHALDLPEVGGGRGAWWSFAGTLTLMNLLRGLRPEIVHAIGERADLMGRTAARLASVPRVVSTVRRPGASGGVRRLALRATAHMPDVLLAATESLAREAAWVQGVHPARVRVVPSGVDLARCAGGRPAEDLAGEGPIVGTLARLDEKMGIPELVDAAAILLRYHEKLRVVIAGTGGRGVTYVRRAQRLGIADRVLFPGHRDDVDAVLAALDVFVMPARRAGLPLALLEAMGAGVPCVATDTGGVRELLEDRVHALLVPPGQPALLADRVDQLLMDEELRRHLATEGRAFVRERFLAAKAARTHDRLYELLVST